MCMQACRPTLTTQPTHSPKTQGPKLVSTVGHRKGKQPLFPGRFIRPGKCVCILQYLANKVSALLMFIRQAKMEDGKTDSPLNTHECTQTHTQAHTHTADSANNCTFILGKTVMTPFHTRLCLLLFHHKHFPMLSFNITTEKKQYLCRAE